jgi:ribonuclease HIII
MPGDPGRLPAPGSAAAPGAGPAATDPDELVPHIGTDEAGKGDYFGPLVCAACYLDADMTRTLRARGVRDRFVGWLDKASEALGTTLPKGAGPQVITTARTLVAAHGPDILRQYAKVLFKTTRAVLENTP